jgi:pilus assembly protein CpaB
MNRRVGTVLVIAFLVALLATFVVVKMVGGYKLNANQPAATTHVIAAAGDIKLGTILADSDLTTMEIAGAPPAGAILDKKNAIGRGVMTDIYKGEPIMDSRLAAQGAGGGLTIKIPQGMRACAVRVDDVSSVSGFSAPGTRVDVLASAPPIGNHTQDQGNIIKTILQNIVVLSAGTEFQKDAEGKAKQVQVVNLLVTPEQAETLSLASGQGGGSVRLVLRNPLDTQVSTLPGNQSMESIFYGDKPKAPPALHSAARKKAVESDTVEVDNGSTPSIEKFSASEGKK